MGLRAAAAATAVVTLGCVSSASAVMQTQSSLRIVKVAGGLRAPTQVAAAPGNAGTLYVVEQAGLVRVVRNGKIRPKPFLDIRSSVLSGGEQGLLGLAFAADYAKSRQFVVNYTDVNGDTRVVRYTSDGVKALPRTARTLLFLDQPYGNHNGGMVAYGPDGLLYVGTGDGGGGGDPEGRAQNPASRFGKLLRLDPKRPGAKPVVVALGLRNPWRFSFDRANGDLWIGDVGQSSIEEVDHVARPWKGLLNFGWDAYEGTDRFESSALGPGRLVQPVAEYSHAQGCSITGGYVYRGKKVPAAKGRYFYGDYCSGVVWSLRLVNGVARQLRREPFVVRNLSSFGEDTAGELYAVSGNGDIYRLTS